MNLHSTDADTPLVSIIIPCRNGASTLAATLDSCLAQTWPALEIIVVDNASSDASLALARDKAAGAGTPIVVHSCPQLGANHARRLGYEQARGAFIRWLDADDQLAPDVTERQVHALIREADHDIAYCDWIWRQHLDHVATPAELHSMPAAHAAAAYGDRIWRHNILDSKIAEARFHLPPCDDFLLRLLEDQWLPPHAYLLRRAAAQRLIDLEAFYPQRKVAQDRECFTLAALLGMRFLYVPDTEVYYNAWSASQITRSVSAAERSEQLGEIFARLRRISAAAMPLTDRHRILLEQPRQLHRVTSEQDDTDQTRALAQLDAGESRIYTALLRLRGPASLEQWAKKIQHIEPLLWQRHSDVLQTLLRLRDLGLLTESPPILQMQSSRPGPRLLLITDVPFWQAGRGDAARIRALVEYLAGQVDLDLFVITAGAEQTPKLSRIEISLGAQRYPAWLASIQDPRVLPSMLRKVHEMKPYRVCLIEYLRLHELRQTLPAGVMTLLDTHDLVSARAASFRKFGVKPPNELSTADEFAAFRKFDAVVLIQQEDHAIVTRELGEKRCILAQHPVQLPRCQIRPEVQQISFIASQYAPNVEGLHWFLAEVWPAFAASAARLHIFGRVGKSIDATGRDNIRIHGLVDDLATVYQASDLLINPVRFGAGLKIKTVEALASGLPLITTSEGARGLAQHAGSAFLVADDAACFQQHLQALIASPAQRKQLADAAWHLARTHFTPDACFAALLARIRQA